MKIIITGGNGFIGKNLIKYLKFYKYEIYSLSIDFNKENSKKAIEKIFKEFNPNYVIHLAGLAHNKDRDLLKTPNKIKNINTKYPVFLANICKYSNVKKFVYISTIGVHGEGSKNKLVNENTEYQPYNLYTISKMNAEKNIIKNLENSKTKYTVLRPSLVIGKNAPGNIASIKKLIKFRIPLPINGFNNKRNIIYVNDLCNLIHRCLINKKANNQIFVASGSKPLTILETFQEVAKIENLKLKSFLIPKELIFIFFYLIGKKNIINKFSLNLLIDSSKAKDLLDWNSQI
ncbi:NAD-dependent epimerase/dehydratase family protein [Prochlorococcus marinus]|uniref:NAD-dependent epimerase/dehydratase family protein n=1 Tax=Prochlorococcus marinus TaxID=1219 RepID=UPI001ADA9F9F|nr:NAD-dependent epimerase/dehydratase family protein [Prochlorococcus marinus]MBO8204946.1 NAD-dependent epimerase/dehydratase family protein [Prochlorococcus marinus CUG1415]MBW3044218.1 hypothetical protein [Prochlorococcus marinus str. MU1415]